MGGERILPAVDIRLPFLIVVQMPAKDIKRACGRLFRDAQQFHVDFLHFAPALAMIAMGAGSHNVRPDVLAAHMSGSHVVHREVALALSTVLAGIIVSAKHLTASQLDVGAWPMNLVLQPND